MVINNKLKIVFLFILLISFSTYAFCVPSNTMSVTPSATAGSTITAADENSRNSSISTTYNNHSHTDISAMSGVNSFTIGDGTAGTKSYLVDDDQASSPGFRYLNSRGYWEVSTDGSAFNALGLSSGVVIAGENTFRIGDNTGIGNKRLIANEDTTDGEIRWLTASNRWEISNDASTFTAIQNVSGSFVFSGINDFQIGDGTNSEWKRIVANTANAAGSDPMLIFDPTRARWRFTNNGTTIQDIPTSGQTDLSCRAYNSAAISSGDGATTTLTFDSERWDTDNMHSTSVNTSRITFTTAGKYYVTASIGWAVSGTGHRYMELFLNGATPIAAQRNNGSAAGRTEMSVSTVYNFAANDYLEVRVEQNSGGALTVDVLGNNSLEFSAQRISSL